MYIYYYLVVLTDTDGRGKAEINQKDEKSSSEIRALLKYNMFSGCSPI